MHSLCMLSLCVRVFYVLHILCDDNEQLYLKVHHFHFIQLSLLWNLCVHVVWGMHELHASQCSGIVSFLSEHVVQKKFALLWRRRHRCSVLSYLKHKQKDKGYVCVIRQLRSSCFSHSTKVEFHLFLLEVTADHRGLSPKKRHSWTFEIEIHFSQISHRRRSTQSEILLWQ